jgi:ABC-type glycerol-3-phosphate transport system substrate-binding protein
MRGLFTKLPAVAAVLLAASLGVAACAGSSDSGESGSRVVRGASPEAGTQQIQASVAVTYAAS